MPRKKAQRVCKLNSVHRQSVIYLEYIYEVYEVYIFSFYGILLLAAAVRWKPAILVDSVGVGSEGARWALRAGNYMTRFSLEVPGPGGIRSACD